jgi:hypothetical protein
VEIKDFLSVKVDLFQMKTWQSQLGLGNQQFEDVLRNAKTNAHEITNTLNTPCRSFLQWPDKPTFRLSMFLYDTDLIVAKFLCSYLCYARITLLQSITISNTQVL